MVILLIKHHRKKDRIMQLTKNFNLIEFACHDGTPVPEELIPNCQELAENLQIIRDEIKAPLFLLSAYRTKKHNKAVGGETNSYHMKAMAGDLMSPKVPPPVLRSTILRLIKQGKLKQGGVGSYKTFTHYDVRGTMARWNG